MSRNKNVNLNRANKKSFSAMFKNQGIFCWFIKWLKERKKVSLMQISRS